MFLIAAFLLGGTELWPRLSHITVHFRFQNPDLHGTIFHLFLEAPSRVLTTFCTNFSTSLHFSSNHFRLVLCMANLNESSVFYHTSTNFITLSRKMEKSFFFFFYFLRGYVQKLHSNRLRFCIFFQIVPNISFKILQVDNDQIVSNQTSYVLKVTSVFFLLHITFASFQSCITLGL